MTQPREVWLAAEVIRGTMRRFYPLTRIEEEQYGHGLMVVCADEDHPDERIVALVYREED